MGIVASVGYIAVYLFLLALILRIAFDTIRSYARDFRPSGLVLVAFELVYSATDFPVKPLRRALPPLRMGSVALDVSILILFFACSILLYILAPFVI